MMRMDMSQEPFYAEIDRKNVAPQGRAADFLRACAIDMHMDINFRTIFHENLREKGRSARVSTSIKVLP